MHYLTTTLIATPQSNRATYKGGIRLMAKVQKHIPLAVRFGRVMESSVKAMSFADRIDQPQSFVDRIICR